MMNKLEASKLVLRLVLGISFLLHGIAKFQGGIANTAGWFDSIGIPGVIAYAVAVIEVAGGISLIVGLGTRAVSILLGILMLGAIFTAKLPAGFLGNGTGAGYELDIAFLAIAIFLAVNGSKMFALDGVLSKTQQKGQVA
ncbi:DoxX family protein [Planococcus chinensis]|uniref:DoxX family protein n=1 Tax=Planococcus chinensis TaxID=272917 RepID=A0ABW4QH15_9BACL